MALPLSYRRAMSDQMQHQPVTPAGPADRDPIESVSLDALRALQLDRLRRSLRQAWDNNPIQRRRLADARVHPDDLRDLSDLARFPFTTKADLREAYPFGLFAVPRDRIVRLHASSGTTGKPTVVGYTARDIDTWTEIMARSIRATGGRPGDIVHNSFGYGLFTGGLGYHYGAERLGCTVVPVSGGMTERQVTLIDDFRPRMIFGTPSYMLSVIDEFRRRGLDPAASSLEIGMFGAEPWTPAMRDEIESAFGLRAYDLYGLSEIIGPGVSVECADDPRDGGMTIWEDHFYPEIIDPDTGAVLPDGAWGELVSPPRNRNVSLSCASAAAGADGPGGVHDVAGGVHLAFDVLREQAQRRGADDDGEHQRDAVFDQRHAFFVVAERAEFLHQGCAHFVLLKCGQVFRAGPGGQRETNRKAGLRLPLSIGAQMWRRIV